MRCIEARYKCKCMTEEVVVLVAERRRTEDVLSYMNYIQMALSVDHRFRSPLCMTDTIEYCKLPADNPDGIGFATGGTA